MIDPTALTPTIIVLLKAETGWEVGDSRLPGPVQVQPVPPFLVVYDIDSPHTPSTYVDPHDMAWLAIQVTSVGRTAKHARQGATLARTALLGKTGNQYTHPIEPAGLTVCGRQVADWAGPVQEGGLFNVHARFRFLVTG